MPRLTQRETNVVYDTLTHLTAYTHRELEEHLGWDDLQIEAWSNALNKFFKAAHLED